MRQLLILLCVGTASGCHLGGSSGGGAGEVSFWFANCGSDCTPDKHAVAAGGAHTTINVTGAQFQSVRSSEPTVATFTRNNQSVEVLSGAPGLTDLEILDGAGRVVGATTVTVVATAKLNIDHGWKTPQPLVLEGQELVFHVTTLDAQGQVTKGSGAVSFSLGGTLSRAILPVDGDAIGFVGTPGSGTISASCPDASVAQSFTIVPLTDITSLAMAAQTLPDDTAIVTVVPQSTAGGVYAGPCDWQTSDASVTLATEVGPALSLGPGTISVFNLTRAGSFTVSCTLAGKTAMVTVQR